MSKSIAQRVDEHTHVPKEKFVPNPPFPDAIKIEITARCNFNCSFCASKTSLRDKGDMDRDFLFRILHEAKSIGVKEIGLFLLGEPFLVKSLPEYIRYAKEEAGIEYVFITTNGSLCTPQRLRDVTEAGLDSIKFSVNAGARERYADLHGIDLFDKVVENIKWFNDYRKQNGLNVPRTCVSSIHMEDHLDELNGFRAMIENYVDEFYFLPLYNQAGHVGGRNYTNLVGNPGRFDNMVPPIPCWGLFNSSKISWNGQLTMCYFDHDSRFEVADLNKHSLLEAWNHPKFVELRERHLSGDLKGTQCSSCLGLDEEQGS